MPAGEAIRTSGFSGSTTPLADVGYSPWFCVVPASKRSSGADRSSFLLIVYDAWFIESDLLTEDLDEGGGGGGGGGVSLRKILFLFFFFFFFPFAVWFLKRNVWKLERCEPDES